MALIVAAAALGCTDNSLAPSDAVGGTWELISIQQDGSNPITVENSSRYRLQLDEDGRTRVVSDCNSCGGSYTLSGSSLELTPLTCTKVFCGDTSLDAVYSQALAGSKTVSVSDSQMTLTGGGVTLQFKRS
jgi:heat shock protein HslJ